MSTDVLPRIALVGSPNSGKTTLFNALTGSRQKTANYAGVTVEKKEGILALHGSPDGPRVALLDLPGTYSLDARTPDEAVTAAVVQGSFEGESLPRAIVAVADSTNLERNLYVILQLRELGIPMIVALTMSDLMRKQGVEIDVDELSRRLGIPVVQTSAVAGSGLGELKGQIDQVVAKAEKPRSDAKTVVDNSPEKIIHRYSEIEATLKAAFKRTNVSKDVTRALDRVLLHRVFGPLILALVFALMFQVIFSAAKLPMDALQAGVTYVQEFMRHALPPGDLNSLVVDGALAGVGSVIVFLPQILLLFAFIIVFEDSGYLARAAFILDRLMSVVGLNGRAFIPLLSSFACAVPGIMAARTVDGRRDRLVTIMVAPLMTCSARIPVYAMLIAAFVPPTHVFGPFNMQGLVMGGMYLFGVFSALVVAAVFKRTLLAGRRSTFVMELPTYKVPALRNLGFGLWDRALIFLKRAGTIILGVSILLWALATYPRTEVPKGLDEKTAAAYQLEHTFAGRAGKFIEPAIRPLGYDWRIGVAILTSFAARETVLSTLGTVYAVGYDKGNSDALVDRVRREKGFTLATALSLLIFYALACQCASTLAVTRRETNSWRWPALMLGYMTVLAYVCAFAVYRLAL